MCDYAQIRTYFTANSWHIILSSVILLLVWLPWVGVSETHIDTEVMVNAPYTTYNWLGIGRFGAVLTKTVFQLMWIVNRLLREFCVSDFR